MKKINSFLYFKIHELQIKTNILCSGREAGWY